jgi:protein TonB
MFPDGDVQGALKYVRERVHYPDNVSADVKGLVGVSFIVNADGSLTDIQLHKGLHPALDEQVIQAFKSMPKWRPAKRDGKSVRSKYTMAVGVEKQ